MGIRDHEQGNRVEGKGPVPGLHESVEPHSCVDSVYRQFGDAFEALDARAIAGLYTDRGLFVSSNATALRGSRAIADWYTELFRKARDSGVRLRLDFKVTRRGSRDGVVFDQGEYDLFERIGVTELPIKTGHFVAVFHHVGDPTVCRIDVASSLRLLDEHTLASRVN